MLGARARVSRSVKVRTHPVDVQTLLTSTGTHKLTRSYMPFVWVKGADLLGLDAPVDHSLHGSDTVVSFAMKKDNSITGHGNVCKSSYEFFQGCMRIRVLSYLVFQQQFLCKGG